MSVITYHASERRPIASRDVAVVQRLARWLVARGVSANVISVSSIWFAGMGSLCLLATPWTDGFPERMLFGAAALLIQARLLANLLDGMVAVGSRTASPLGELYNEVPDRVADACILIGAGFAGGSTPSLGYLAALLAVFVAYIRALGSSVGVTGLFIGPMAKPQRMATVTVASIYVACVPAAWPGGLASTRFGVVGIALAIICAGAALTAVRRLQRIAAQLRRQS
ncbi:MAG TPA: CDP-alcohol phosphatidyltransferase family protein [Vicinamibacterales bacterium]|nr:CDP-alcohol phosphatidyltransferase family protein [Vicinamibacterales bacterium]